MAKEQKAIDYSLEGTLIKLDKDFGKGTVIGATDAAYDVGFISSGSIGLDIALGIGGYAEGRIVEIYGPESSGKTTLCLHACAEGQKKYPNKWCGVVDAEHALDLGYAKDLGVNLKMFKIAQPQNGGEEALEVTKRLIQTNMFSVIFVDSVAALVPKSELQGEVGDAGMGKQARLMSQALRMLTGVVQKSNTVLIFTNQLREKIGVMFGSPETTTGGNALKFYASQRLDIRKTSTNIEEEEAVSNRVKVTVKKNKLAPPFRKAEFNIVFGEGIDTYDEVVEYGSDLKVIDKSGSWFSYGGNKIGHGKEAVIALLKDNPELYQEIKQKVFDASKVKEVSQETTSVEEALQTVSDCVDNLLKTNEDVK